MSAETGCLPIATGAGLAVVGMALVWAAKAHAPRRAREVRQPVRRPVRRLADVAGALACTSVACAAITGLQWAVLSQTGPGAAWAVVLWLPAFLAGATVARLLAVLRIVHRRQRQLRAARRERGGSR